MDIKFLRGNLLEFHYCPHCGETLVKREIGDEGMVPYCTNCDIPLFDMFSSCIIALVVNTAGEAVLLRQNYISAKYMNLVSGYMKPGETAELTARREILEETGLRVQDLKFAGTYWFGKKDMLMIGFIASTEDHDFNLSDEVDQAMWVPADDAIDMVHPEGSVSYALLKKYLDH
jgi:NAD+ diphosphatase